jgi:hypothetical protein
MTTEQATTLQEQWIAACESVGLPYITRDTAARIFAIVYVHGGGEEEMVLNRKFINDVKYIQRRFGIDGGCVPEAEFASLLQGYVRELEQYERDHQRHVLGPKEQQSSIPEWAHKLMKDRYGMKLHG